MKTAVILGSEGQDGRIAFDFLVGQGYRVLGFGRKSVRSSGVAWEHPIDITQSDDVTELIRRISPDEIYYLAACHQSSQDKISDDVLEEESRRVNVEGLRHCLEAVRSYSAATRVFYAASSLIFEQTETEEQDEDTPFCPATVYGVTKRDGLLLARHYREAFGLFASVGILYNHESPYRRENFISKKIIREALEIKQGRRTKIVVGNLDAQVDWGYAPDYVDAMHRILQADRADEFIIATGIKHTVRDFIMIVFEALDLDWTKHVTEDPSLVGRRRPPLVGNPHKLMEATGWRPSVSFEEMIHILLQETGMN